MNRIPFIKRFIFLAALMLKGSISFSGCESGSELSVEDFNFDGPHKQFGVTSVLCEGAGALYTKDMNIRSGEILIKSITAYYDTRKKQGE